MSEKSFALSTPRLRLTPFSTEDLVDLHRLWTDPDVRRYLWDDRVISEQEAADVIELSQKTFVENGFGFWSLLSAETSKLVGFAGLRHFGDEDDVEILYGLSPSWWHRGLATESSREVLRFAFEDAGLREVYAGADPPNQASFEVMQRLGFRFHDRRVLDGQEAVYYLLERADWESSEG